MIRVQHIAATPEVTAARVDHHPEFDHNDPEEEVCRDYAINFVENGSFELRTHTTTATLTSGCVFVSKPGAIHRYKHFERAPSDVCVSVILSQKFSGEFFPLPCPEALAPNNRLAFLRFRLRKLTAEKDAFALEDWASDLVWTIHQAHTKEKPLYRAQQLRWYAERIEAVREMFEKRFSDPHSLASTARSVAMSPFQFARVFRELVGSPPHQYLLAVRLNRASQMLLNGSGVTEACFDVGFSNLSHFTRSFRRRYGCLPSEFKSQRH